MQDLTPVTQRLLADIEAGKIHSTMGYLVGLDRPAILAPDPAALLAARRNDDVIVTGHRWRIVTEALWKDLLSLGRERPEQRVTVVSIAEIEAWISNPDDLSELDKDGWRGNQGTVLVLPLPNNS
jgi:hypothetical protein